MLRYLAVFACFMASARSGVARMALEPLPEVVRHLHENSRQRLIIGHPGDEQGSLWAHELRSWRVAPGILPWRIQLTTGGGRADVLELRIQD